jgi:autotransporter-associated beta strand protein
METKITVQSINWRLSVGAVLVLVGVVYGDTHTWDGGGTTNSYFSNATNWVGDVAPVDGDALVFDGTARLDANNDQTGWTLASVTFNSGAGAFVITGNDITLTGAITNNDNSDQAINLNIAVAATLIIDAASGNIIIGGVISGAGGLTKTGNYTLTLKSMNTLTGTATISAGTVNVGGGTGTGTLNNCANIVNNSIFIIERTSATSYASCPISGSGSIQINAAGPVTFGSNSYTGSTTVNAGTLNAASTTAFGNNSAVIMADNAAAVLDLNGYNNSIGSLTGGGTTGGTVSLGAATLTIGGDGTSPAAYAGVIFGTAGAVTKIGAGTLTLSGTNTYTGTTTINAGTIQAGSTSAFGSNSALIMANVSGAMLDISGYNNSIGSITGGGVNGGNVTLGAAALTIGGDGTSPSAYAGIISGTGDITKIGLGTLTLSGANTYSGTTTIAAGTLQIGDGGTTGAIASSASITNNGTLTINRSDPLTISQTISGTGSLSKTGPGTLTLSGSNTYSGNTTVAEGMLQLGSNLCLGGTSSGTTVNNGAVLDLNGQTVGAEPVTINGSGIATNGALVNNSAIAASLSGAITLGSAASIGPYSGDITLSGVIGGSGILTISGNYNLVLSADNSAFSNAIEIGAGTVTVPTGATLAAAGLTLTGGTLVATDGTLDINGDVSIVSGTLTAPYANQMTVSGSWTKTGGTFNHSGGTVRFDATSPGKTVDAGGSAFNNIYFGLDGGGGWTLGSNLTASYVYAFNDPLNLGSGLTHSVGYFGHGSGGSVNFGSSTLRITTGWANFEEIASITPGTGTLEFTAASATQTFTPKSGVEFPNIVHSGAGTLQIATNALLCKSFSNSGGFLDFSGKNISTTNNGNFTIANGAPATISNLGGCVIATNGTGAISFSGSAGNLLNLNPGATWTANAGGGLNADFVNLGDCNASSKPGVATNSLNGGNNTNWTFVRHWTNGGGDNSWGTTTNWSPNGLPTGMDSVVFSSLNNANCTGINGSAAVKAITFLSYTANFYFNYETLTVFKSADFSGATTIDSGYGAIRFVSSDVSKLFSNSSNRLPTIMREGSGTTVVAGSFKAKSVIVSGGIFDFGSAGVHDTINRKLQITGGTVDLGTNNTIAMSMFEGSGGILQSGIDTLIIHGNADFSGLSGLTAGAGAIIIQASGGAQPTFYPGSKTFNNLILWNSGNGASGEADSVVIGSGSFVVNGNLVLRQNQSTGMPYNESKWKFNTGNPSVTVNGNMNVEQISGAMGVNSHLFMGSGTWTFKKNAMLPIGGGTGKNATIVFSGSSGLVQRCSTYIASTLDSLGEVRHTGPDTLRLMNNVMCSSFYQDAGILDLNGKNLSVSGDFNASGSTGIFATLDNPTITIGGDATINGSSSGLANLVAGSMLTINMTTGRSITAQWAKIGNCQVNNVTGEATNSRKVNSSVWGWNISGMDISWAGSASSSFKNPNNWIPTYVPADSDNVVFNTGSVTCDLDTSCGVRDITFASGYTGSFNFATDTLTVAGNADFSYVGDIQNTSGMLRFYRNANGKRTFTPKAGVTFPDIYASFSGGGGDTVVVSTNPLTVGRFERFYGTWDWGDIGVKHSVQKLISEMSGEMDFGNCTLSVYDSLKIGMAKVVFSPGALIDLEKTTGEQVVSPSADTLPSIRHAASGTVKLSYNLKCNSYEQTSGVLNNNGYDLFTRGDISISGNSTTFFALDGRTISAGGNLSFTGQSGDYLNLNPNTTWYANAGNSLTATYATIKNSDADLSTNWGVPTNCTDGGSNTKWDFAAPTSSVLTPPSGFTGALSTITGDASDGGSGVASVSLSVFCNTDSKFWDGSDWVVSNPGWVLGATGTTSWSFNAPVWINGKEYVVKSRATDNAGNVETPGTGVTFTYDIIAPTSSISTPANNSRLNALSSIMGSADDGTGSGLANVSVEIFNQTDALYYDGVGGWTGAETWVNATVSTGWSLASPSWTNGKTYIIKSKAADLVGNVETPTTSVSFIYDDVGPDVSINQASGQADPTNNGSVHFTAIFSEPVTGFSTSNINLTGSSAPSAIVSNVAETIPNDGTTYDITVSGMTGNGTVMATIPPSTVNDLAGNGNTTASSSDNSVTYDGTAPTVTIDQGGSQPDPTNGSSITFTVIFSEPVTGFGAGGVSISGTAGSASATGVNQVSPNNGTTYEVTVSGMSGSGTVIASVNADAATDGAGNGNSASTNTDNTVTWDGSNPTVTVNKKVGQADPTNSTSILYTVVFSEPVGGFSGSGVALAGSTASGATVTGAVEVAPNDGTTYEVTVSGMTGDGSVVASVGSGVVGDAAGNLNDASTSTDNTVTIDGTAPTSVVVNPANNSKHGSLATINGTALDGETNVSQVQVAIQKVSGGQYWTGSTWGTLTWLNATGAATWTYNATGIFSTPGSYVVQSKATDAAGNVQTTSTEAAFTVDGDIPASTITTPANNTCHYNVSSIMGTASDAGSGVCSVMVAIYNQTDNVYYNGSIWSGTTQIWRKAYNTNSWWIPSAPWTSGKAYIIKSQAIDSAGNAETDGGLAMFTIDQTAPGSAITSPVNNGTASLAPVITGTAVDSVGCGAASVKISLYNQTDNLYWNGSTWDVSDPYWTLNASGTSVWSFTAPTLTAGKTYVVKSRAADGAGNTETAGSGHVFTCDNTAPTVTVNQNGGSDPTAVSPVQFIVTFNEPVTGFTEADVTLSGAAAAKVLSKSVVQTTPNNGSTYLISITFTGNTVGTILASIPANAATDASGNGNTVSTSTDNSVYFDNVAPIVAITSPLYGSIVNTVASITGTAADTAGRGISAVALNVINQTDKTYFNGTSWGPTNPGYALHASGTTSWVYSAAIWESGKTYVVGAQAIDSVGNSAVSPRTTFTFDSLKPSVVINQATGQTDPATTMPIHFTAVFSKRVTGFSATDVTISGTATGAKVTGVVEASPNNGATYDITVDSLTGSGTVIVSMPSGVVTDSAGNTNAASTSADNSVYFDNTALAAAPVIAREPLDDTVNEGKQVQFKVSATGTAPLTFKWMKNGVDSIGADSMLTIVSVTATDNGTALVCFVANTAGADTSRAAILSVNAPLGAKFVAAPVAGAAPLTVVFTDSSTGAIQTRRWSFGDGTTDSAHAPSHVYMAPGVYTAQLSVAGPAGIDSMVRVAYINVGDTTKPFSVRDLAATAVSASSAQVTWLPSTSEDADSVALCASTAAMPVAPGEGEFRAVLAALAVKDTLRNLPAAGVRLFVAAYVKDRYGNWSTGARDSVDLPDGVAPVNNLAVTLSSVGDSAIGLAWKTDTTQKDAKTVMFGCAFAALPAVDRGPYLHRDTAITISPAKQVGAWIAATILVDAAGNKSAVRYDTVIITNTPPVFALVSDASIMEDALWLDTLVAADINNDKVSFAGRNLPAGVTLDGATGILSWIPNNAAVGRHTLVVAAQDDRHGVSLDTLQCVVVNVNDPPVITFAGDTVTSEDSLFSARIAVVDQDSGDTVMVVSKKLPAWMSLTGDLLRGVPKPGDAKWDTLMIIVADKAGLTDTLTQRIAVLPTNHAPLLASWLLADSANERSFTNGRLVASDIDRGDSLMIQWITRPVWLLVQKSTIGNPSNEFILGGTPAGTDTGKNIIVFSVTDRSGASFTVRDTLIVVDLNDPPLTFIRKNMTQIRLGAVKYYVYGRDDYDSLLTIEGAVKPLGEKAALMTKRNTSGELAFYPLADGRYEFSAVAIDGQGLRDSAFVCDTFVISGASRHAFKGDTAWQMVSVPGKSRPISELAGTGSVLHWDEQFSEKNIYSYYRRSPDLVQTEPGKSYWRKSPDSVTVGLAQNGLLDSAVRFTLSKDKYGWNQIASPYPYPVKWSYGSAVWKWNPATRDFEDVNGVLEPWQGYWVAVDTATSFIFDNAPDFSAPALSKRAMAFFTDKNEWQARVVFSHSGGMDAGNILGFSAHAHDGYDAIDAAEPPRMNGDQYVFFYHPEWKRSFSEYARDIRRTMGDAAAFQIGIAPGGMQANEASISIEGIEQITGIYFYIGDEKGMAPIEAGKPYAVAKSGEVQYKTIFVTQDSRFLSRAPQKFSFGRPYPNPTRNMANIKYCLPYRFGSNGLLNSDPYTINLCLYNAMGRQVRQLVYSMKSPGYYTVRWDGKSNSGLLVASGTYYIQLQAGPYNEVQRLVVIK